MLWILLDYWLHLSEKNFSIRNRGTYVIYHYISGGIKKKTSLHLYNNTWHTSCILNILRNVSFIYTKIIIKDPHGEINKRLIGSHSQSHEYPKQIFDLKLSPDRREHAVLCFEWKRSSLVFVIHISQILADPSSYASVNKVHEQTYMARKRAVLKILMVMCALWP